MVSENNKRSIHTARVRMVLMASSSVFPYGMMGRRAMGYVKERSPGVGSEICTEALSLVRVGWC